MRSLAGQRVLVTGAAGFIGMHVAAALRDARADVTGVDNLDPYYDVALKEARIATLAAKPLAAASAWSRCCAGAAPALNSVS